MASLGEIEAVTLTGGTKTNDATSSVKGVIDSLGESSLQQEFDFIGIANETGVQNMKDAINKYCTNVTNKLGELVTTANPQGTFAGQYSEAVLTFVGAMKGSCMYIVDQLKSFETDLDTVYAAMKAKDTTVASGLTDQATSLNNTTGYSEANPGSSAPGGSGGSGTISMQAPF